MASKKNPAVYREGGGEILDLIFVGLQVWILQVTDERRSNTKPPTPAHSNRTNVTSWTFRLISGKQFCLHQLSTGRHVTRAKYQRRPAIRSLSR